MKIGFLVNDISTEKSKYTTIRLAMSAVNLGHEAWLIGVGDLAYLENDRIRARGRSVLGRKFKQSSCFLKDLLDDDKSRSEAIAVEDLDVLMLRNDPSSEPSGRAWARSVGIHFGRIAVKHGVIVLNDPDGLSNAQNKLYFQQFPKEVRPETLITRDREEIKAFAKRRETIILKPLSGSGGKNVFLASSQDIGNINQMIDAVSRDGYVMAQEYLPEAKDGDVRLFLMNGVPLKHKGKYAAFKRKRMTDDIRSNIHAGGQPEHIEVDSRILKVTEMVRPRLVKDGMFLVGVDIAGDRIIEVNVFSPGGLGTAQNLEGVNFCNEVIRALERKVKYMQYYGRRFDNNEVATL